MNLTCLCDKIKISVQAGRRYQNDHYQVQTIFFETGQLATLERETKKSCGVTSLGKK